ncbi:MAG: TonB-dependent receptor [Flavobacteriaceae bacterium]
MKNLVAVLLLWLCSLGIFAQNATIQGVVTNANQQPIPFVTITTNLGLGTTTNENGFYRLDVPTSKQVELTFSHISHKNVTVSINVKPNSSNELHPVMNTKTEQIGEVVVQGNRSATVRGVTVLSPKTIRAITGANAGVENLLLSLPGVNSNNELSTQYAVRGGNYDENLVYVNGIEVYRPTLIRAGQQEGLSFLNPDLIQNVVFKAGGFEANYGDKLSSVLDITYKTPTDTQTSIEASLLGGSISYGTSKNNWSAIAGARYRDNQLLVNQKETSAQYQPSFADLQTFITYQKKESWKFQFLGSISRNDYNYAPQTRQTNFGTLTEPRALLVFYNGEEQDVYQTYLGALKTTFQPNNKTQYTLTASLYHTKEQEYFDILAQYLLGAPSTDIGSEDLGEISFAEGVGSQHTHGRNDFDALISSVDISGNHQGEKQELRWGIQLKSEDIRDRIVEWEKVDSAGFSIRPPALMAKNNQPYEPFEGPLVLFNNIRATQQSTLNRISGYLQWNNRFMMNNSVAWLSAGVRLHHWELTNFNNSGSTFISPRVQLSLQPVKNPNVVSRFSLGSYTQAPFYRELRDRNGNINPDVKPQQSLHIVSSQDRKFLLWNRPFVFQAAAYYKYLWNVNPYTLENVRIRYLANNNTKAWVYGLDMRLNGEFVPGTESWISLGVLKSEENQNNRGKIARPTDQRLKFAMLFQDYVPRMPFLKMNLNLVYNRGLPGGSPSYADPYNYQNRLRDYKRADIGFLYVIKDDNRFKNTFRAFDELQIGVEIINVFDVQNAITNTWVRDVYTQRQFGVPNYMTPRVFNVKLNARF